MQDYSCLNINFADEIETPVLKEETISYGSQVGPSPSQSRTYVLSSDNEDIVKRNMVYKNSTCFNTVN